MSEEEESSGSLAPGSLQNLKKLFEERNAQSADDVPLPKAGAGRARPKSAAISHSRPIPPSAGHPRPPPRVGSPGKKVWVDGDTGMSSSPGNMPADNEYPAGYASLPRPRQRNSVVKEQEWSATLGRKPSSHSKHSVSSRVAMFSGAGGSQIEAGDEKAELERRVPTPAARSGNPKRLSDPCNDLDGTVAKRNSSERRRTVDSVSFGPSVDPKSPDVKVMDQAKRFQEKPSIPKKPAIVSGGAHVVSNTASPQKNVSQPTVVSPCSYEDPWDLKPGKNTERLKAIQSDKNEVSYEEAWDVKPGKNVERLKSVADDQQTQKVSVPHVQGGSSAGEKNKPTSSVAFSPPKAHTSRPIPRPTEQPPPPPSKPPRVFTQGDSPQNQGQSQSTPTHNAKGTKPWKPSDGESHCAKDQTSHNAVSTGGGRDKSQSHPNEQDTKDCKGIRERPPARPPPPRPRPKSALTAAQKQLGASVERSKDGHDSENEGPIVISLRTGKRVSRVSRQVSMSGPHRNPHDQLPETPEGGDSVQRFPLRKCFSSECLNSGSLSDLGVDDDDSAQLSMMQSCIAGNAEEPLYEAVMDNEGYAIPHQFVRLENAKDPRNKAGFFKRFLASSNTSEPAAPPVPTTTPVREQDVEKVPSRKMNLVKQKINQAFEALHLPAVFHTEEGEGETDGGDVRPDDPAESMDADSIVDVKEIKRRVTYCSTVRLKTHQSVKKAREFMDKIYPQLFEYALIVGLSAKTDDPGYTPIIIHKFPQTVESNVSVAKFCFPDADEFRPGSMTSTSESYSFVLTNIDGGRMYGYCRRLQPRDASLPEVICIISPVDAFNMYDKLLSQIEARRYKSLDHAQEMIAASFGRPLPKPGKLCHIRSLDEAGEMETIFLERPLDQHLANVNYESLLLYLGTDKLIKVFASMLMERRLILCSKQLSVLTQTIHALVALLYPFQWQHVYIPLLPPDMIEVCASPTPFIIGILHSQLAIVKQLDLEDVIIMDLDSKSVVRSVGDEMTLLPKKVQKALKTAINMCKIDSDVRNSQWLMVAEAFLRMFLETIGHFAHHISTQQDGTRTLLKEQFIAGAASKGIRQFLEWFTETQMFEVFINMHLERQHWGSMDLFMSRLGELQSKRQADGSHGKGIGQKVKNLGKVIKTKLRDAS